MRRPDPSSCLGHSSQEKGRCRRCFQRQRPGWGWGEGRASGGASSRWGCSYCGVSPLWEPRNLEPQSPRYTGLHLSTAPALAVCGGGTRAPRAAQPGQQVRTKTAFWWHKTTCSHPASSCKAETGQEVWNPLLMQVA